MGSRRTYLTRLVLELTEHVRVQDSHRLVEVLRQLRVAGAWIALDDAGSGYSGLQQIALVRPQLVKLDRALVDHVDRDEVKLALAELLGAYASRLDAALLAEGVERLQELEVFVRLGVPLAQGWLFARPGATWPPLPPQMSEQILALRERSLQVERVGSLVDVQVLPVSLRLAHTAALADAATRAMTRPAGTRFDPVVCADAYGGYLGVVRPELMTLRLAALQGAAAQPPRPHRHPTRSG